MPVEKIVSSKQIFSGHLFNLRLDQIEINGKAYQREVIEHPGATAIVALDTKDQVILVEQYRSGAATDLLEIPAGGLEDGEDAEACARRELQEEIGMIPEELIRLGGFYVAASYSSEFITVYLARKLKPSQLPADVDEKLTLKKLPIRSALHMVLTNEITDSKTIIGLIWAAKHLGIPIS
jgi:ADP-ribose pyrophosphatase